MQEGRLPPKAPAAMLAAAQTHGQNGDALPGFLGDICVPLTEDLTQPIEAPQVRIERVRYIIREIEKHYNLVAANLLVHFDREKERLLKEARKTPPNKNMDLSEADSQTLIKATSAMANPQAANKLTEPIPYPYFKEADSSQAETPREYYYRMVMDLVETYISRAELQKKIATQVRESWQAALQRELAQDADFLGRR
jgi:hypothetical protein